MTIAKKAVFLSVLAAILFQPVLLQADQSMQYGPEVARKNMHDSMRRAGYGMGYRSVMPPYYYQPNRDTDFGAISRQIDTLSNHQSQARGFTEKETQGFIPVLPGDGLTGGPRTGLRNQLQKIYGPDGPNQKSVQLITEYRLHIIGNPHIQLGEISENPKWVRVSIVTKSGALVERYEINKKTGLWTAIH